MKILIADDDPIIRGVLKGLVARWEYEAIPAENGDEAWTILQEQDAPPLVLLDWKMPGLTGPELCKLIRNKLIDNPPYVVLVTANSDREQLMDGFEAGADDYLTKPFDPDELKARLRVGVRMLEMRQMLADRVKELEVALIKVKRLQGLLPLCAWCKKIRNDKNYWQEFTTYVTENLDLKITHGICPDCLIKTRNR